MASASTGHGRPVLKIEKKMSEEDEEIWRCDPDSNWSVLADLVLQTNAFNHSAIAP
jgi:hypothetical protein